MTTEMYGVRLDLLRGHELFAEAKRMAPEICRRISSIRKYIEEVAVFMEKFEDQHHLKMEARVFLGDEKQTQDWLEFLTGQKNLSFGEAIKEARDPLDWWTIIVSFTDIRRESKRFERQKRSVILWLYHFLENDTPVGEAFFRFERFIT